MSNRKQDEAGFSLVEVTLALGVAGFCLIALMALLPIGIKTNQTAFSQTAAATILSNVVADMRSAGNTATTSPQYGISFSTRTDRYFDSEVRSSCDQTGTQRFSAGICVANGWSPPLQLRYRVVVTPFPPVTSAPNPANPLAPPPPPNPHYATYAAIKISWPAKVDPSPPPNTDALPPAGLIETVAAFDRH